MLFELLKALTGDPGVVGGNLYRCARSGVVVLAAAVSRRAKEEEDPDDRNDEDVLDRVSSQVEGVAGRGGV